jgi:hypothetical protein
MARKQPLVSVIMPVYNGERYLREAIISVLNQSFADFECIIVNDGSTDQSEAIIMSFDDPRIHYITQKNKGLAATLNVAIEQAKGTYLARQDQDDVSLPERFAMQVDYLEKHKSVGAVGTWASIWVEESPTERVMKHPTENWTVQFNLLFNTPFVHSSVMIRKTILDKVGLYSTDPTRQPPEDYELWSRIGRVSELANLETILLQYRETGGSMSRTGTDPFAEKVIKISSENIAAALDKAPDDPAVTTVAELAYRRPVSRPRCDLAAARALIQELVAYIETMPGVNKKQLHADAQVIMQNIDHRWPRSFAAHLFRGILYKIRPSLIDHRKAVQL